MTQLARSLKAFVALTVVLTIRADGQKKAEQSTLAFEQGRWEIVQCTVDGKDCPNDWVSDNTGPVSTISSLGKKIDEIQCYKQEAICVVASAGNANGYLYASLQRFFVVRWDDRGIEANWVDGGHEQKLEVTFTNSGVDSVILDDSLTKMPKEEWYKNHLVRYQLIRDSQWRH